MVLISLVIFATQAMASFDVPSQCARVSWFQTSRDAKEHLLISEETLESESAEGIANLALKAQGIDGLVAPWLLQSTTHPKIAKAAYLAQKEWLKIFLSRLYPQSVSLEALLRKTSEDPQPYSEVSKEWTRNKMREDFSKPSGIIENLKKYGKLVCIYGIDQPSCFEILQKVGEIMDTREGTNGALTSLPLELETFLTDYRFGWALSGLALEIDQAIAGNQEGISASNIWLAVRNAFQSIGLDEAKSEEWTWTFMGLMSTRGASWMPLNSIAHRESFPAFAALSLISASLSYFDARSLPLGKFFSLPDGLKNTCAYNNIYHFWLPAYLTHRLIKEEGIAPKSIARAMHLFGKLYEFGTGHMYNDRFDIYRNYWDILHPVNIKVKMNLAFHDLGFIWGSGLPLRMSQEDGISQMQIHSEPLPKMSNKKWEKGVGDEKTRYLWFHQLIAPNAYIERLL